MSSLHQNLRHIRLTVKTKIWMAVTSIVLLFSFFVLFYLPAIQEQYLLNNFNKEVQNHANTVALGVKIAMTEQNFQGVQTAMDFVKQDPLLNFVSLVHTDTTWNKNHTAYQISRNVFKTYPEQKKVDVNATSNDSIVVKRASFSTPAMNGEIVLASSTKEIVASKKQIRATSLLFSSIVFSIGIMIGFGLARNISVPVLELRDAATKVGQGDLTQRVSNTSRDEIGELGIAFNIMVMDLSLARREVEDRTSELIVEKKKSDDLLEDLKTTLTNLRETQEQLIRQEKLASLGELTAGIAHEIQNPLNFVTNFSEVSIELLTELEEEQQRPTRDLALEAELLGDLTQNLGKIHHHGKRAASIVKGMLEHSRASTDERQPTNINALADEYLRLAYQGLRAKEKSFNATLSTDFAAGLPLVTVVSADLGRVFLNLSGNAFYAVRQRQHLGEPGYVPTVSVSTRQQNGHIEIRVQDNGTGISPEVQQKIFQPFFTTKPAGEGTGLGLSLSYDIITKSHGGTLAVESEPGAGTTFLITLPIESQAG